MVEAVVPYNSSMAVTSLVWGILGIICCCSPLAIIATVLAALAMDKGTTQAETANRYARLSLWLNVINLVLVVVIVVIVGVAADT